MARVIALAGKGGTGKTTVAGLLVRALTRNGHGPVLAVDADPNSCLDVAVAYVEFNEDYSYVFSIVVRLQITEKIAFIYSNNTSQTFINIQ